MNELKLRLSLAFALAAFLGAGHAHAAVSGHRADAPPEADTYTIMRQGPGVDEQTVRDMRIASAIQIAFCREDTLNPATIDIQVDNGAVRLAGTVGDQEARELAERIARETENVSEVSSELQVRSRDDAGA